MQAFVVGQADGGHAETTRSPAAPAWARNQGHDNGGRPASTPTVPWACASGSEDEFRILESPPCSQMSRPHRKATALA